MKKYNYGISALLILISLLIINNSLTMNAAVSGTAMGPGVWPIILSAIMILLSAVQILQTAFNKKEPGHAEPVEFKSPGMKRIYIAAGLIAVFCALLRLFGFYLSMVFLLSTVMYLLGERNKVKIAAITAGILAFIFVVFVLLLDLKMPAGMLFK